MFKNYKSSFMLLNLISFLMFFNLYLYFFKNLSLFSNSSIKDFFYSLYNDITLKEVFIFFILYSFYLILRGAINYIFNELYYLLDVILIYPIKDFCDKSLNKSNSPLKERSRINLSYSDYNKIKEVNKMYVNTLVLFFVTLYCTFFKGANPELLEIIVNNLSISFIIIAFIIIYLFFNIDDMLSYNFYSEEKLSAVRELKVEDIKAKELAKKENLERIKSLRK